MQKTSKQFQKTWGLYLLLLPAVVLLICFTYIPMYGVTIAFKSFTPALGISGSPWVGFDNFMRFFHSYLFGPTIKNTLLISVYGILAGFPLPILLALMVNQMPATGYRKTFQTMSSLPHFISTVVLVGMILIFLSPSSGLIGGIYKVFGAQAPNLMASSKAFSSIYVWSGVWQNTGWDSIIYIAALSAIDVSLYEAATVDGATVWDKIIYIDLPLIMPTACILLLLNCSHILGVGFEKIFLMQNALNLSASEVLSTYVYKIGIMGGQYSLSTAINLFNTVINFVLLILVNMASKKLTKYSLW